MRLYDFNEAGLAYIRECDVVDDDNQPSSIMYWFDADTDPETGQLTKVHVGTDWAVEFSFNVMEGDTPETLIHMAESCIKDAYYDEDF